MRLEFKSAAAIPPGAWKWPHVDAAKEWACHGDGSIVVETTFLDRFEKLRQLFGKPLPINSGYRTVAYDKTLGTGRDLSHTTAHAADIRIFGSDVLIVMSLALEAGFRGFGLQQKGDQGSRYIHLDDLVGDDQSPRPWIWTY